MLDIIKALLVGAFFVICAALFAVSVAALAFDNPQPIANSTVFVTIPGSTGSGVSIGNSLVITAAHVVDVAKTVGIQTEDGAKLQGDVLWADKNNDVALIHVTDTIPSSPLACEREPAIREPIEVVGNPLGILFIHTFGQVSRVAHIKADEAKVSGLWPGRFFISAPVAPGMSGGPVFDKQGSVIGMVVALLYYKPAQSPFGEGTAYAIGIAVRSSTICKLIKQGTHG